MHYFTRFTFEFKLAGYLGSSLVGALLVFSGFDRDASKVGSIFLGLIMLSTLYWSKDWLGRGITLFFVGLVVGLWFWEKGHHLVYFTLFMGVMSCLYSLWDIVEDLVKRTNHESDAAKFAKLCSCFPWPKAWGVIWLLISLAFMVAGILGGILAFK
jgi:hypothetical protein